MNHSDNDDLYIENYYEFVDFKQNRDSGYNNSSEIPPSWTVQTRFLVTILLRFGFILVQVGSVPVTNVNLILLQNVVEFSCITLVYALGGHVIAYSDLNELIGKGHWIGYKSSDTHEAIAGWQAIVIASAISTSCLVGRTHTVGYLFIGILTSGVLQPFLIQWAWSPNGWMAHNSLDNRSVVFRDVGGSAVVHLVGSLTGLIGSLILGRRILRLRDIDDASVSSGSAGTAFAGYLLILLGLQSVSSSAHNGRGGIYVLLMVMNYLLSASACSLVVVALHFFISREPFNHWTVMRCFQAFVAGLVTISAGVDVYTPILCIGLGCSGGIVFYLVSRLVFRSALEDYCNVIASHLSCAFLGSVVEPLCHFSNTRSDPYRTVLNFTWQVICLVVIVVLVSITMIVAFGLLECFGLLRNRSEIVNHLRAVVALERGPPRSYLQRLFLPDAKTVYLQPGSAPANHDGTFVSQRFAMYESALGKLDQLKTETSVQSTQRLSEPEVIVESAQPTLVLATRVKKLRQIHTIRSINEIDVSTNAEHGEARDDNQYQRAEGKVSEKNIYKRKMQCSGDVAEESDIDVETACKQVALNSEDFENTIEKSVHRRMESYRLRRTTKFMNLRLEAISEYNEKVEFLVKPRPRSFTSTESESDDDTEDANCPKYLRKFETTVVGSSKCPDINL